MCAELRQVEWGGMLVVARQDTAVQGEVHVRTHSTTQHVASGAD